MLETRLDSLVLRAGFASTIFAARQFVSHGHIHVNGQRVTVPSYRVKVGDNFEVREKSRKLRCFNEPRGSAAIPSYISVDDTGYQASLSSLPARGRGPDRLRGAAGGRVLFALSEQTRSTGVSSRRHWSLRKGRAGATPALCFFAPPLGVLSALSTSWYHPGSSFVPVRTTDSSSLRLPPDSRAEGRSQRRENPCSARFRPRTGARRSARRSGAHHQRQGHVRRPSGTQGPGAPCA